MRKRIDGWRRIGVAGLVGAIALVALGDRGLTQVPPVGIDPLEILDLQVRANAIIVLDSSGSMGEDSIINPSQPNQLSGDTRFSKMYQAKQVISRVIAANETGVSFQFGRYTQPFATMTLDGTPTAGSAPGAPGRFHYTTTNTLSPGMTVNTIVNLRSYVVPAAAIITIREPANSGVDVSIPITAGRYATGIELATEITNQLNLAAVTLNTYTVTYLANHRFEIRRTANNRTFQLRWQAPTTTAALRTELGFANADDNTGAAFYTSDGDAVGDIDLLRSNSGNDNPVTATAPPTQYFRAYSRRFFNGQVLSVLPDGRVCSVVNGPPGTEEMFDPFNPTVVPANAPYIILETRATCAGAVTQTIRMEFGGPVGWQGTADSTTCGGFEGLVPLQPCTNNDQFSLIAGHMQSEVRIQPDGSIAGYTETAAGDVASAPTPGGIRAAGFTPLAETLEDFKTIWSGPPGTGLWGTISGLTPKPRTFAIIVTDGDDTCPTATTSDTNDLDNQALRAAYRAQLLYQRVVPGPPADPASGVTTFVVAFGAGVSADRANWIAWGGSGMVKSTGTTGPGDPQRWNTIPSAAQRAACTTCIDAFVAADVDALTAALQAAIDQGQSAGEFSDQQSITESIFELIDVGTAGAENAVNPQRRYSVSLPVLLQSTFEMPEFRGRLKAFRNVLGLSSSVWDAGQRLQDRVTGLTNRTFEQLCGAGAAAGSPCPAAGSTFSTSSALIKRRIYTTDRNGVFLTGTDAQIVSNLTAPRFSFTPPGQIALWPPSPAIDPPSYLTPGPLDVALGLTCASGPAIPPPTPPATTPAACGKTFAMLQSEFGACTSFVAGDLPVPCRAATPPDIRFAVKEARQIILAHAAGANLAKNGTNALRLAAGDRLQFSNRQWVMAESTLAASAVVTPPLESLPAAHNAEYKLFRDGPRTPADLGAPGLEHGFGLRNPDLDANPAVSQGNGLLKPVMSVIYHGSNHMVHAFRAGPQAPSATACTPPAPPSVTSECGGEELWAFVPFDQLSKLAERVKPQLRSPHTFVVATPIRVTDIFVPGNFSVNAGGVTVAGTGVWRTVILFGRGIAGKYLTAIDVTSPGRFNELSLSTAPPIVMWSRGNPDTTLGSPTVGTPAGNAYNNNAADFTAYTGMGLTWSVPAITFVTAAQNTTVRRPQGTEFVAYTGSGYGDPTEGTTIYTLDMLTGDVVRSADINDRTGVAYENALVAPAAAFNPDQLRPGFIGNPAASKSTRIYLPDIHGRIWRVLTDTSAAPTLFADAGADQPFANAVALVNYEGTGAGPKPHIFAEAGNESRIFPPPADTPPFKMFGLRDDDLGSDPNTGDDIDGPAFRNFSLDFPNGFRGTVQPATAFNDPDPLVPDDESARVFFAGTRFNPLNTPNAPQDLPCRSSFDSVLFAVGAETGGAAYNLNLSGDDRSIQLSQQRIQAVRVSGGRLVVDTGLSAENAPPPPAPPAVNPPAPAPLANILMGPPLNVDGTSRIPGLVTYKVNSSVCR